MRRRLSLSAVVSTLTIVSSLFVLAAPASATFEIPDGKIAYVAAVNDHKAIFVVDLLHTSDVRPLIDLTDRNATQPAWSPDSSRLAFTGETTPGGATAIFVANADASGIEQLTSPSSGESDSDPSWSSTGDQIVFGRTAATGLSRILIVEVATSGLRALDFPSLPSAAQPDWSPDGQQIAFVAKASVDPSICGTDPKACSWNLFVANADGSGQPRRLEQGFDFHDPDWSPNGTWIAVGLSFAGDPASFIGLIVDAASGGVVDDISAGIYEPSWSPTGHHLIARIGATSTAIVIYDQFGTFVKFLVASGSQPTWGIVQDISAPTVALSAEPDSNGWFTIPNSTVGLTIVDDRRVVLESVLCTLGGAYAPLVFPFTVVPGGVSIRVYLSEGADLDLECSAADGAGNVGRGSTTVNVDYSPAQILSAGYSVNPKRVDQTTNVTVSFVSRYADGVSGRLSVGNLPAMPMALSGSSLTAEIGTTLPSAVYPVSVSLFDHVGRRLTVRLPDLAIYDPAAGSVSGTGWIVPAANESDNQLPVPIDGTAKASFSFSARYKNDAATVPAGSLLFSYGGFKLQSSGLRWLVVPAGPEAYLMGSATIRGMDGTFVFRATVFDGDYYDTFRLQVWAPGSEPGLSGPVYFAHGFVGGQIQIKR